MASNIHASVAPGTRRIIYRHPDRPGMYDPFRELSQKFPGGRFLRCEGGGIAYWLEDCCFIDSGYHLSRFDGMAGWWSKNPQTGLETWTDNTGGVWTKAESSVFMKDNDGNMLAAGQWYMSTKGQWFIVGLDSKAYTNIFDAFHLKNPMGPVSAELSPATVPLLNTTPGASSRGFEKPVPPNQPEPTLNSIESLQHENADRGELLLNDSLSFGTESEALIAFVKQSDCTPFLGLLENTSPILVVPDEEANPEIFIFRSIKNAINEIEDARVFRWKISPKTAPKPQEVASENPKFWGWDVIDDPSLQVPPEYVKAYGAVKWFGVEITSPAYQATLDNVDRVRRVIDHLSRKFRFFCPEICGTHVHVSRLGLPFSRDELVRIASVTYTAGPLVSELHNKSRLENGFCFPNHSYSALAAGKSALDACNDEADNMRLNIDNPPIPLSHPTCVVVPAAPSFMGRSSDLFPRIRSRGMLQKRPAILAKTLLLGVNEIMRCPDELVISRLMVNAWGMRGAYSFSNYGGGIPRDEDKLRIFLAKEKPTLEFRQAAGTMNADDLVAWLTIVCNLTTVAVRTGLDSLSGFLQRCAAGAEDPAVYDTFDLLIDIHLPRTARYIQSTLVGSDNSSLPWELVRS